jgi:hypothetical protein
VRKAGLASYGGLRRDIASSGAKASFASKGTPRRNAVGSTRGVALLALACCLAIALWESLSDRLIPVMSLSVAFIWGAGIVLIGQPRRSHTSFGDIAIGTLRSLWAWLPCFLWGRYCWLIGGMLVLGLAILLFGVGAFVAEGQTFNGVGFFLLGLGLMSFGCLATS